MSHQQPLQAHCRFRSTFLPKVTLRDLRSTSYLSIILPRQDLHLYLPRMVCSMIYSTYPLIRETARTSQKCFDVLKLLGSVWVGSEIPMPTHFATQVVFLQISLVASYIIPFRRDGRNSSLIVVCSGKNKGSNPGSYVLYVMLLHPKISGRTLLQILKFTSPP